MIAIEIQNIKKKYSLRNAVVKVVVVVDDDDDNNNNRLIFPDNLTHKQRCKLGDISESTVKDKFLLTHKTEWLLQVPPVLRFKDNKFYSHNAFVFFVQVLKSTAFISLKNVK